MAMRYKSHDISTPNPAFQNQLGAFVSPKIGPEKTERHPSNPHKSFMFADEEPRSSDLPGDSYRSSAIKFCMGREDLPIVIFFIIWLTAG